MSTLPGLRRFVPPVVVELARRWSSRSLRYAGHPADWADAARMSSGYAATNILERVVQATRAVESGAARSERDSVLFDHIDHPFPLLAALYRAAAGAPRLNVIDFGGSLGSSYRQCRPFLDGLQLQWFVLEQPGFVAAGRHEFETAELKFLDSLADLPALDGPSLILASSVLQYLEHPYAILDELARLPAAHLVIDRSPVGEQERDRLCIQHVPAHIYAASYPCWIFSRSLLQAHLRRHWRVVSEYDCTDGRASTRDGLKFGYEGWILERAT